MTRLLKDAARFEFQTLKGQRTSVSSSDAFDNIGIGFRGTTKKCTADTGFTSWNAMHCNRDRQLCW